jgi:dethiobiotin synthetase
MASKRQFGRKEMPIFRGLLRYERDLYYWDRNRSRKNFCLRLANRPFAPDGPLGRSDKTSRERISPWRFRAPISPDLAARREGRRIDVGEVVAFCKSAIDQRREILLIEGIGGIMVPLDEQRTVLDIMMALRLPLILVAGSYLGTISHTLTALDALFRRDLSLLAIIVSETPGSPVPLDETVAAIARFAEPVIGLPRQPAGPADKPTGGTLAAFDRIFGAR